MTDKRGKAGNSSDSKKSSGISGFFAFNCRLTIYPSQFFAVGFQPAPDANLRTKDESIFAEKQPETSYVTAW